MTTAGGKSTTVRLNFGFNGLCSNEYGTWKFNNGTVDFGYNGFAADGENTWYVVNGRVATEYSGTVDGKEVRNGQVMDTIVIQVVHHDRDRTGAVTEGNPDTSGLVGYTEYLAVPVDKEGNITEPVYISYWCPDDYGFTSDISLQHHPFLQMEHLFIQRKIYREMISVHISKTVF